MMRSKNKQKKTTDLTEEAICLAKIEKKLTSAVAETTTL